MNGPDAPKAILANDTGQRLDAIIRRHGGKPTASVPEQRMVLPSVGRRECPGQIELSIPEDEQASS